MSEWLIFGLALLGALTVLLLAVNIMQHRERMYGIRDSKNSDSSL